MRAYIRGVRHLALTLVLLLPLPLAAADTPAGETAERKRLDLGPYRLGAKPELVALPPSDTPKFHDRVEVHGRAHDAAALTAKMEWWLRDFEYTRGAVPLNGSAPSLLEMRDHRPTPPLAVDILPVLRWLSDKLSKK